MFFDRFWRNRIAVVEDIFSRVFRKNVSTPENPTLTLKKQVFEAWKSSKIDHLDGRHQCKFIFSLFSWNFGKSFKTLNVSNSYPQNDESKSCKITEIHKELLKKHPFYIIFDRFLQKYKATATIYFYETWSNRSSDRESNGSSHFDTFEPRKSWIQPTDAAPKNQFFKKTIQLQKIDSRCIFLDFYRFLKINSKKIYSFLTAVYCKFEKT